MKKSMQLDEIEMEKRKVLLRDFQNGLTPLQAKENIVKAFGNCVGYGERTCDRWFIKFKRGDLNLRKKPRDKLKKSRDYCTRKKSKKSTKNTIKVNEVNCKEQELPPAMTVEQNSTVQNLIKSKPELTISKVPANSGARVKKTEANIITKRLIKSPPTMPILLPNTAASVIPSESNAIALEMPKLRPRRPRSKGIEIQLPASTAKRLIPQTLTEHHSIGEGSQGSLSVETSKNTITENPGPREVIVQFQNMSPEVAKNTVRKPTNAINKRHSSLQLKPQNTTLKIAHVAHVESMSPEKNKTFDETIPETVHNKRDTLPQASSLTNQKGIIYLNPQEIFRQRFGSFENSQKRQNPYIKSAQRINTNFKPTFPPASEERQDSVMLCDSDDSGDDILFPENIRLPAPKIKTDTRFTTYWDIDKGEPIQLNVVQPIELKPAPPLVIEID